MWAENISTGGARVGISRLVRSAGFDVETFASARDFLDSGKTLEKYLQYSQMKTL